MGFLSGLTGQQNSLLGDLMLHAAQAQQQRAHRANALAQRPDRQRFATYHPTRTGGSYRPPPPAPQPYFHAGNIPTARGGSAQAYRPGAADRIGDALESVFRGIGIDPTTARRARNEMGAVPLVGDILTAASGADSLNRGNYMTGAGELGLAAIGAVPGVGDAVAATLRSGARRLVGARAPIRAYHGSPYDFDRFEARPFTGEGTAAYGNGTYLAENPEVAGTYAIPRQASFEHARDVPPEVRGRLQQALRTQDYLGFDSFGEALNAVRSNPTNFEHIWELNRHGDADEIRAALREYDGARWGPGYRPRLYEVDINATPEDFIDYDAVGPQNAFRAARSGNAAGLTFFDQGSRQARQGTRNYVVFDPGIIDIVNKY